MRDRLTDTACRSAKPSEKVRTLFDGGGLYLEVTPKGGRRWRFKYRFQGRPNRLSLGLYPDVSLKKARARRDELRVLIADGIDPSARRKAEKAALAGTFEAVAREWLVLQAARVMPVTLRKKTRQLETHLFPWLGSTPIISVEPTALVKCLRRVEADGHGETAHRVKQIACEVFAYGIACGYCKHNPAADIGRVLAPTREKHRPGIVDPGRFGELLRCIDAYGTAVVRAALQLDALVFLRNKELRKARWEEIDLEANMWTVPGPRMKMKRKHLVPLARQTKAILSELRPLTDRGPESYVFPSQRGPRRSLSSGALGMALRSMGFASSEHVPHGFRTSASTMLKEMKFEERVVEMQLSHAKRDRVAAAYDYAKYLDDRIPMMQVWADFLDACRAGNATFDAFRQMPSEVFSKV